MSVLPSSVFGSSTAPYFVASANGTLKGPLINPFPASAAGTLDIRNYDLFATDPSNSTRVVHFMTNTSGGGLTQNHYQLFMYGATVGGNNIAECWDVAPLGNNNAVFIANNGGPLDSTRRGKITGTGSPQTIDCPSVTVASDVYLAFIAGTPAVADPVITITPDDSFTLTLPAGAVYQYEVVF
jgi:hypothetical protein